jgi:hypothetical protein
VGQELVSSITRDIVGAVKNGMDKRCLSLTIKPKIQLSNPQDSRILIA